MGSQSSHFFARRPGHFGGGTSPGAQCKLLVRRRCYLATLPSRSLHLRASARNSDEQNEGESDSIDITKMSLEELEALPELGECTSTEEDRPPMVEELMAEDKRFGMKMKALRGDFDADKLLCDPEDDTESGVSLAATLMPFPGTVEVRVVVKKTGPQDAVPELVALLNSVQGVKVLSHSQTERMNGKFVTLDLQCLMQSAESRYLYLSLCLALPAIILGCHVTATESCSFACCSATQA